MKKLSHLYKLFPLASLWMLGGLVLISAMAVAQPQRMQFQHAQMGTQFRIVLYAADTLQGREAAEAAFARIDQLNDIMSDYFPESELNKLSATAGTGKAVKVSTDLWEVLSEAQAYSQVSEGAFDVSVGPLVQLWRRARRKQRLPDSAAIHKAKAAMGYAHILMNPKDSSVVLALPNMRLDLGGIAKGYAVDEAMRVLERFGISQALIDGGGDLYAGEAPPDAEGWRVELTVEKDHVPMVLVLENQAIATSGDAYRYFEYKGVRYSHIVDPREAWPLRIRRQVSIVAPSAIQADAWASAISVLGREGLAQVHATEGLDALLLQGKGEQLKQHFTAYFSPLISENHKP